MSEGSTTWVGILVFAPTKTSAIEPDFVLVSLLSGVISLYHHQQPSLPLWGVRARRRQEPDPKWAGNTGRRSKEADRVYRAGLHQREPGWR